MRIINLLLQIFTIAVALVLPAKGQSSPTDGLVLYYPFNGNANDASGNGNDGTVQYATLTTNRFGAANGAYAFDGVQSRIQVPETIFGPTVGAVTISMWVATDNQNYSYQDIFEKGPANGEMNMEIWSGQFAFGANLVPPYNYQIVSTPVISNAVTHLVGVYRRGQSVSLYTNGVLAANMSIPNANLWQSGFPLASALGIYNFTPSPYHAFRGNIEDVRIYTNALAASQVQQLYQYEAPSFLTKGLVTSAGNANDAGGNGNNRTVLGGGAALSASADAQVVVNPPGFMMGLYPGITVTGTVGSTYIVQSNPDLTDSNGWTTVGTMTLTQPAQLWVDTNIDASLPANPHRFYRFLPGP